MIHSPIAVTVLQRIGKGDAVLFQQAAVFSCISGHHSGPKLIELQKRQCRLYVLQDDLNIYGVNPARLLEGVNIIDFVGFVELTVQNRLVKTWC